MYKVQTAQKINTKTKIHYTIMFKNQRKWLQDKVYYTKSQKQIIILLLSAFRYEKMISGLFLGEIVRLILVKLKENGILYEEHWSEELDRPGRFYTKYVSEVLK